MKVSNNAVVTFRYTLTVGGQVLDQGELPYLHGHNNIVQGLEEALEGTQVGQSLQVSVPPEKGYGLRDPEGTQVVSRDAFPDDAVIAVGEQFFAESPDGGRMTLLVVAVEDDHVTVDFNHPLAGETLNFEVTITEIRQASGEELDHGHVHGPQGHHH
jgi:FKBP-type peptidyl-prolyl cis-trans isomerase SlyD